jgi:excisionase family DNA binding protein
MQLLTYAQAADRLACSPRTVQRMVAAGGLAKITIGRRGARVAAEDVDAYIRAQLRVDEQPAPATISSGKRDAFFAKCNEIARLTGRDKLEVVDDYLHFASERFHREISSVNDLTSEEASAILDLLDAAVRRCRLTPVEA